MRIEVWPSKFESSNLLIHDFINNKTEKLLGHSSWFNYMDCFEWEGIIIWPYTFGSTNNEFIMGYPGGGAHKGTAIEINRFESAGL